VGEVNAQANLKTAIDRSIERAGVRMTDVELVTFALAGVKDSNKSTEMIQNLIQRLELPAPYELLNDGEAGFDCRFYGRDGIVAAAGTGMICYSRIGERYDRCSGWGWFIGDEGGAFYIGRRSLQEAAKISDGRADYDEEFLQEILQNFGVAEPRQLVNVVYTNPIDVRRLALVSRTVSRLASKGNKVAVRLLQEAASEAANCVIALKSRNKSTKLPVSGFGGVYRSGDIYWTRLKDEVLRNFPGTEFLPPLYGYHAVLGSVYRVLGTRVNADPDTAKILRNFNDNLGQLSRDEKENYLFL